MTPPGVNGVRQWHILALERRAAQHHGALRRALEDKLQLLRAAQAHDKAAQVVAHRAVDRAGPSSAAKQQDASLWAPGCAQPVSPLADLLVHMANMTRQTGPALTPSPTAHGRASAHSAAAPELKAIRDYRSTWSHLSAERRLHQALAKVPDNAGPLNTQRLLHQALRLMHGTSPAYLLHFMAHTESLLALDTVNQPLAPPRTIPAR
jgi:Protein of unknown function (DUF2894)